MEKRLVETVRQSLMERRRAFIRRTENTLAEEQQLLEQRLSGVEDRRRQLAAAWLLDRVAAVELAQLRQVQAALDRLAEGRYGWCLRCAEPLEQARLLELPEADRCGACVDAN